MWPKDIELPAMGGDYEWMVRRDTLGDALQFMNARLTGPKQLGKVTGPK